MPSRSDFTSPSRQDKNAGNSGDLVKHTVYLTMLRALAHGERRPYIVEAHGGKGVYISANPHLRQATEAPQFTGSVLGRAQAACFAPPPAGLGNVEGLAGNEVAYAGSGALHATAVANGTAASLELLDSDAGVRSVAERVFSETCFLPVRGKLRTTDPKGQSEPSVLSRLRGGELHPDTVLHLDPFAFVMKSEDVRIRALYGDLIRECASHVGQTRLAAASVFFTWGSNNAAARDDLFGIGYGGGLDDGYQALVAAVPQDQRLVVTWCWEFYFSLLCIVPAEAKGRLGRVLEEELAWLTPLMRMVKVDHVEHEKPPPQPRELPWSWERSQGWLGQYERLRRWKGRIRSHNTDDLDGLFDFVLAFFMASHHLRDWLLRLDPSMQTALDELFATTKPLRLGADIANIAKHFDLTRPARAGWQLSFAREYVPGAKGWFGRDGRLVVLSGGEKIDVLDLVSECEMAWTKFLEAEGRL
jgi:hypothetical protein